MDPNPDSNPIVPKYAIVGTPKPVIRSNFGWTHFQVRSQNTNQSDNADEKTTTQLPS